MIANRRARLLISAGAATLALFVWGALSHLFIIKGVGYAAIPDERRFLDAASSANMQPGLYAFPAPPDWRGERATPSDMAAWQERFQQGPAGLLIVRPRGESPVSAGKLGVQLAADALAVALALYVISGVSGSFRRRAATVTAVGFVGLATVGVIYWNWYAFTNAFFAAQCVDVLGGWIVVGCVLAALAPQPSVQPVSEYIGRGHENLRG